MVECDPNYPGYCRDDNYEKTLYDNLDRIKEKAEKYSGDPISTPVPSHWEHIHPDFLVNDDLSFFTDPLYFTPNKFTAQHAIEYLEIAEEYLEGRRSMWHYYCNEYPRDTVYCQHLAQVNTGGISKMINNIRNSIELAKERQELEPEVFTAPEPEVFTAPEPEVFTTPEPETVQVEPPGVAETRCYMVYGQKVELTEQAVGYYINAGVTVTPCQAIEPEPTVTVTPTVTPNFGIAGILFAGVLALPILAGLGKWK